MSGDIRYRVLGDDETDRLYRREPGLNKPWNKWCPTCDTKGWFTFRGVKTTCECDKQRALFKWYAASGIGTTYMRLDWADFEGSDAILDGLAKYESQRAEFVRRGMGLYFSGTIGSGKTMLGNLVLKDVVKAGYTAFATTFAQTVEMYTAGWTDKDEKAWFQHKFLNSQFLLLDDVGREMRGTRLALSETTFDSILRQRVSNGRPTIITTNMDASDLEEGYGSAILSLIREKSLVEEFTGVDFRPKANVREVDEALRGWSRPIV